MRSRRLLVLLAGVTLVGAACGEDPPKASRAFCLAADRYDRELTRQQRRGTIDLDRQTERVQELADTAPAAIRRDAERFLGAMRQVATDPSVRDDPAVRRAVDAVNRYANQACNVYSRESGI